MTWPEMSSVRLQTPSFGYVDQRIDGFPETYYDQGGPGGAPFLDVVTTLVDEYLDVNDGSLYPFHFVRPPDALDVSGLYWLVPQVGFDLTPIQWDNATTSPVQPKTYGVQVSLLDAPATESVFVTVDVETTATLQDWFTGNYILDASPWGEAVSLSGHLGRAESSGRYTLRGLWTPPIGGGSMAIVSNAPFRLWNLLIELEASNLAGDLSLTRQRFT